MSRKYRVCIVGFAHMHINNVAALFARHPQVEMVACADTVPVTPEYREAPNTRRWNQKYALTKLGVKKGYEDYQQMLAQERPDIVIVTSENAQHASVVETCATYKAHVCVEKPMATSLAAALRMSRACQTAGTTLLVDWPLTWAPAARKMKSLIMQQDIGRLLEVKWRAGHMGPLMPGVTSGGVAQEVVPLNELERGATWWYQAAAGGGALLDACSYGAMLSLWFIGEPATAAMGMKANLDSLYGDVDDNSAMLVRFPHAMALLEGSWTTLDNGVTGGPIAYGTTGTLVMDTYEKLRMERGRGQTILFRPEPLPAGREDVAAEMIHHLQTGEPLHQTLEAGFNVEAMAILDAGARSAASGELVLVNNPMWQMGV